MPGLNFDPLFTAFSFVAGRDHRMFSFFPLSSFYSLFRLLLQCNHPTTTVLSSTSSTTATTTTTSSSSRRHNKKPQPESRKMLYIHQHLRPPYHSHKELACGGRIICKFAVFLCKKLNPKNVYLGFTTIVIHSQEMFIQQLKLVPYSGHP